MKNHSALPVGIFGKLFEYKCFWYYVIPKKDGTLAVMWRSSRRLNAQTSLDHLEMLKKKKKSLIKKAFCGIIIPFPQVLAVRLQQNP